MVGLNWERMFKNKKRNVLIAVAKGVNSWRSPRSGDFQVYTVAEFSVLSKSHANSLRMGFTFLMDAKRQTLQSIFTIISLRSEANSNKPLKNEKNLSN